MRQVSIKELRKSLGKELDNLPFVIMKRGVPIAKCTPCMKSTPDIGSKCTLDDISDLQGAMGNYPKKPKKVIKTVDDVPKWVGGYSKEQQTGRKRKKK